MSGFDAYLMELDMYEKQKNFLRKVDKQKRLPDRSHQPIRGFLSKFREATRLRLKIWPQAIIEHID